MQDCVCLITLQCETLIMAAFEGSAGVKIAHDEDLGRAGKLFAEIKKTGDNRTRAELQVAIAEEEEKEQRLQKKLEEKKKELAEEEKKKEKKRRKN